MAESPDPQVGATAPDAKDDQAVPRNWVIPVVTAVILASVFCLYYFVYVGARREYLVNRNFRELAALGDHIQRILSTHGSILEFYADLADSKRLPERERSKENLAKFLLVRPEDRQLDAKARDLESRRDYLKYLAPTFDLVEKPVSASTPPRPRLEAQRRGGQWYLMLSAVRHAGVATDYLGSLKIADVLKLPAGALPFDDILLVSETGTVVYQAKQAGPQFTTLSGLLKARIAGAADKPPESAPAAAEPKEGKAAAKGSAAASANLWEAGALHLTDVMLAGTRYKLFLQPILIDVFNDDPTEAEPAREWVLCGLRSASNLEWESLSISYTLIIGATALFLAISMGGPLLKVMFLNHRERFRLRELGFLSLFLVLLAAVFTLSGLQLTEFRMNDSSEAQLRGVGAALSTRIHDDLDRMRRQLKQWCESPQLPADLKAAEKSEIIRNTTEEVNSALGKTPPAAVDPFINNGFWTDDDGHQVVKWSTSGYVTPMIDLSKQPLYMSPKRIYLDGTGPPFYFGSTLPPNKLEYLAAIGVDTQDCNPALKESAIRGDVTGGSAFLTGEPLSLIDPILPFGYGFALVDDSGAVLFHSDKTKNGRENFREESEWNSELYAAMFGHASSRSLHIKYLGKDYRAVVVPIPGLTQAPWSLIVFKDLNEERTLALQTMIMASTLTLWILAVPALAIAIWAIVRRPKFAPEWLWPNRHRLSCYWYQICVYVLLIAVFLLVGFGGPAEQIVVASAFVPYTALLLTLWCFRRYPAHPEAWRVPDAREPGAMPALVTVFSGAAFLWILILHWSHLKALVLLPAAAALAVVPLLNRPRLFVAAISRHRQRLQTAEAISGRRPWTFGHNYAYAASVILLVLLFGVLMPMALFRGCLEVERRLGVKQAQLHLASDFVARRANTLDKCEDGGIGAAACEQLRREGSEAWNQIVLASSLRGNRGPAIEFHQAPAGRELYEDWFRGLIYLLHHDYNGTAAETLGLISDRVPFPKESKSPEWYWENNGPSVKLRWHGVHPAGEAATETESDVVLGSEVPSPRNGPLAGVAIAAAVMLVIGGVLWMLVRKMFLVQLAPLKMTGIREVAESLRLGKNILVLAPPFSDFEIESAAQVLDLKTMPAEPGLAQNFDVDSLPSRGIIEIRHFEHTSEVLTAGEKLALLGRLMQNEERQIAAVMFVPVSTEDYRKLFPQLAVIDLREEPFSWLKQYGGPARDLIWTECHPLSALWPLGAQLAKDLGAETAHSRDTVASEILERADPYYRLIWSECSNEQRFVLSQLAEDGMLNPMNGRAIRQMVRRGLIVQDPQFRIMNESFRRFLRSAITPKLKEQWLAESRRSGWGKMHGAFFTTMIVLGAFLLTTQNALWQSSAAYVTTAFGALGTLAKLFNTFRGAGGGEKAN